MIDDQRSIILEILLESEKGRSTYNVLLNDTLDKYSYLDKSKRSFIGRVVKGTVERRIELDYIINLYSKVKVNKLKPVIRNIFRMSIYQLLYMEVPSSAVCNEAVKLAGRKGFSTLKGFVNGVLRTVERSRNDIPYPDKTDRVKYLSVVYSCPEWITEMIISYYGDAAETILKSTLESDNLYIRTNVSKITPGELINELGKEGITARVSDYLPYALIIDNIDSIIRSINFRKGLFQVQDLSSQLVIHMSGIKKGDHVLDICGAPGGKTLHALDFLDKTGSVVSRDISENKTRLIEENVNRCGFSGCTIEIHDASVEDDNLFNCFDLVICDLPCSGLGIMGRKNDIKYRMTEKTIDELISLQRRILAVAYKYVKIGGTLMFSTCTINRMENHDNVVWIRDNLPLMSVSLEDVVPAKLMCESVKDGYLQLTMGLNECDGFFISKFKRVE